MAPCSSLFGTDCMHTRIGSMLIGNSLFDKMVPGAYSLRLGQKRPFEKDLFDRTVFHFD